MKAQREREQQQRHLARQYAAQHRQQQIVQQQRVRAFMNEYTGYHRFLCFRLVRASLPWNTELGSLEQEIS